MKTMTGTLALAGTQKSRTAMTWVEVVTALAVIGALLLLIRGRLSEIQYQRRTLRCKDQLFQIAKACTMYSEPNGDFFPAQQDGGPGIHPDPNRSLALLYPEYVKDPYVFICRSTEDRPQIHVSLQGGTRRASFGAVEEHRGPSYGYDAFTRFRLVGPSTAIAADMDGSWTGRKPGEEGTANHAGGQNVMYHDSHVQWQTTNFCSASPYDNIYTSESGWGPDTDACIKRTAGD